MNVFRMCEETEVAWEKPQKIAWKQKLDAGRQTRWPWHHCGAHCLCVCCVSPHFCSIWLQFCDYDVDFVISLFHLLHINMYILSRHCAEPNAGNFYSVYICAYTSNSKVDINLSSSESLNIVHSFWLITSWGISRQNQQEFSQNLIFKKKPILHVD